MKDLKTMSPIKRQIKAAQVMKGYDNQDMADMMGITVSAYMRRLRRPEMLKVSEAAKLDEILGTTILSQKTTEQHN